MKKTKYDVSVVESPGTGTEHKDISIICHKCDRLIGGVEAGNWVLWDECYPECPVNERARSLISRLVKWLRR